MAAPRDILSDFPELLFPPTRATLRPAEVAEKVSCTTEQVFSYVEEGSLSALDITGKGNASDRRHIRIPTSSYYAFLRRRLKTGWSHKDEPDLKQPELNLS